MRSKLYVIHNTTDNVARGEVSLHLNAFACPSPIKERKWGWIWRVSPGRVPPSKATKMALDGGTRLGDTLQILPLALPQPPNPRSITSHSVLRGHPSLTHRVVFFRGIQWGIHSQKIIIGTAICFFKKMCISDEKY